MISFLIKKAFFDMWDNLLTIFILNFGYILVVGAALYFPYLMSFNIITWIIAVAISIILFYLYTGTISFIARDMSDYKRASFKAFVTYFKETWKASLVISGITIVQFLILFVAVPFYLQMRLQLLGIAALSLIVWISIIWWISSQFYFPIHARLDTNIKKILKKSFVVFFDNTIFSLTLGIGTIAILVISGFTAFLLPGLTSLLLWHQVGLKLRMLKYDYIEENPEADKKKIPWDALLIDEKDRVGQRTLKGMIFPWKE